VYPSAAHALEAFLVRSRDVEEAKWAHRLAILLAIRDDDLDAFRRISPPVGIEEVAEVLRLVQEFRHTGGNDR
jgi:hypothetical protein